MVQNSHHKNGLETQIKEAFGRVVYTYTTHLKLLERLAKRNRKMRFIQIVLSAVSTGGFIGAVISSQVIATWIGGLCATALLALNLFFKDFNLLEEMKQHQKTADELWLIREQYVSLLTDLSILTNESIIAKRDELQQKTYEIYKQSPKTDSSSYAEAQRALKYDEEQFFTPEEIDKLLPSHLRTNPKN